jgi:tetratricopeptide (TPR) repeat protein
MEASFSVKSAARRALVQSRHRIREAGQALTNYTIALSFNPKSVAALQSRAQAYAEHKQPELAIQDYSSVLALRPDAYSAILRFKPGDERAYLYRADDLSDLGRDGEALRDYDRASRIDGDCVPARNGAVTKQKKRCIDIFDDYS